MTHKKSYYELLKHPKWQQKRLEVLKKANFCCSICDSIDNTLHVHHGAYLKGRKPWEYDDDMYHVLCESCHELHSNIQQAIFESLAKIPPEEYINIKTILDASLHHKRKSSVRNAMFSLCMILGLPFENLVHLAEEELIRTRHEVFNDEPEDEPKLEPAF